MTRHVGQGECLVPASLYTHKRLSLSLSDDDAAHPNPLQLNLGRQSCPVKVISCHGSWCHSSPPPSFTALRAGMTPVNHAKDNRTAIKEQSSKNQLKKMEELAALEAKAKVGLCRLTPG